jgi:hypothetical protein
MSKNINPEVLGGLDWERQFAQTHSFGGQKRRVQLDRGESWLIRFLPVALGESKRFYARIARHWQDKRQIVCPRLTEPAFGGNVEAYCPVCNVAEEINADKNEEISKAGYKLSAQMQWLTYCAVFEKTAKGGEPRGEPMNEVLLPYEFNHYKGTWDELCAFIAQNKKRTPLSVLDYMLGNDFYVTRGKNIRLDKQDAAPIFDSNDPKFDEYVSKLEANCKDPVVKVPTDKQLEDFAAKAEEAILSSGRPGGRTARFNPDDEREPDADAEGHEGDHNEPPARGRAPAQDAPPRRSAPAAAAPAPARTAAPARAAAPAAAPARTATPARAAAPAAAPARRAAAPPPPDPEPEQQPESDLPPEGEGDLPPEGELPPEGDLPYEGEQQPEGELPPEDQQPEPEPEPAPPARRPAPAAAAPARTATAAPARPAATATARPQAATPATAARRTAPVATATARPQAATAAPVRGAAPAAAAPRRTNGAPIAQENLDPEENIPEEGTDQAPPEPMEGDGEQAPPPVQQKGAAALGDRVRNRVAAITGKK